MTQTLTPGGNAPLDAQDITIHIDSGADIDVAAYRLAANGKVRGDGDMIFYGQQQSDDGSVRRSGNDRSSTFAIDHASAVSACASPPADKRSSPARWISMTAAKPRSSSANATAAMARGNSALSRRATTAA